MPIKQENNRPLTPRKQIILRKKREYGTDGKNLNSKFDSMPGVEGANPPT